MFAALVGSAAYTIGIKRNESSKTRREKEIELCGIIFKTVDADFTPARALLLLC